MNNPQRTLLKTCTNCGLEKPLSAFMQITGPEGTSYTNICSDCRQLQRDDFAEPTELDEETTVETRNTIDAKSKIVADNDKINLKNEIDEKYFDERERKEERNLKQVEKKQSFLKEEREHRDTFLNRSSFLSTPRKSVDPVKVPGTDAQRHQAERFNFAAPVEDTRVPQAKHSGAAFQQFKTWLGKSAPIATAHNKNADVIPGVAPQPTKDDVVDYIENTWGKGRKP